MIYVRELIKIMQLDIVSSVARFKGRETQATEIVQFSVIALWFSFKRMIDGVWIVIILTRINCSVHAVIVN